MELLDGEESRMSLRHGGRWNDESSDRLCLSYIPIDPCHRTKQIDHHKTAGEIRPYAAQRGTMILRGCMRTCWLAWVRAEITATRYSGTLLT